MASTAGTRRMADVRSVRRRRRQPVERALGVDAAACLAHRRGHTALAPPKRPIASAGREPVEFLTTLTLTVPDGTAQETVDDLKAREAVRARELAELGRLVRLWTPPNQPGQWRTLGLWSARDAADLTATLESLPLYVWMTIEATPLTPHPSDPVRGTGS